MNTHTTQHLMMASQRQPLIPCMSRTQLILNNARDRNPGGHVSRANVNADGDRKKKAVRRQLFDIENRTFATSTPKYGKRVSYFPIQLKYYFPITSFLLLFLLYYYPNKIYIYHIVYHICGNTEICTVLDGDRFNSWKMKDRCIIIPRTVVHSKQK